MTARRTRVCVSGGGNLGTALCCYLKRSGCEVSLLTSDPAAWSGMLTCQEKETGTSFDVELDIISNDPHEALCSADILFITQPTFLIKGLIERLAPHLSQETLVCFVPGCGGKEFVCQGLLERGVVVAGLDRVPCIARIETPHRLVVASKKPAVRCATLPSSHAETVSVLLASLFDMTCTPLPNYLTVTLTPTNPLLHTARLFSLFHEKADLKRSEKTLFYAEWNDLASSCLLAMDAELQAVCAALNTIDLSMVIPLIQHYESSTAEALTRKMRSIVSLKDISAPLLEAGGYWLPDRSSRYFLEDFPCGLCVVRDFADIAAVACPTMDTVLHWYEEFAGVRYFVDGQFAGDRLAGDLKDSLLPKNYDINSLSDLQHFYQ